MQSTETTATARATRAYLVEFTWHYGYQGARRPVVVRVNATSETDAETAGRARVHNEVCGDRGVTVKFVSVELAEVRS